MSTKKKWLASITSAPTHPHHKARHFRPWINPRQSSRDLAKKEEAKARIEDADMRYNMVVFSLVLMVAAAFFASATTTASSSHPELRSALSTKGHEEDGEGVGERSRQRRTWPCCDRCGGCTKSTPPQCQCQDMVRSCHPSCRHCVRSPLSVSPPLYQCMDRIPNYCRRRCTPEPLLAQ